MRLSFFVVVLLALLGFVLNGAPVSWPKSLDSLKKAHAVRFAATGGVFVLAAMVDIAKTSDRSRCKERDSRSFFRRLLR